MGLTTCPLRQLLSGHHGALSHRGEDRDFCIHPIHRSRLVPQLSRAIHPYILYILYILYIHTSYTLYIPIHSPSGYVSPLVPFLGLVFVLRIRESLEIYAADRGVVAPVIPRTRSYKSEPTIWTMNLLTRVWLGTTILPLGQTQDQSKRRLFRSTQEKTL